MLHRRSFLSGLGASAVVTLSPRLFAADERVIAIQPLGKLLPEADVDLVKRALAAFYVVKVTVLPRAELPKRAYYKKRRRYRAEKLLDFLQQKKPDGAHRILGLTGVDISTTKGKIPDWGILGLASMDGTQCVLSEFRCKRRAKNKEHVRIRLGKVAVHEIGHTFGLPHCPNRGCLMEDGHGTVFTTDREYDLCVDCRQKLIRAGYELADGDPPWPKPEK